ncbi:SDR family NAD(P)-dependent oxidoreductase [Marininema halotolerans]|uniref:Polysaccharide biosynthesis protein n=1 Tax=Marininema halotolerans TaxID=1155944 RepID=A0A1I6RNU4_9BACL|nr:SDR family NAD(P)-dependent oxidoreductase [Marininema halotolerans]SFS66362.1 Polysaccharide biosynthesis protein [Marininema halotolerans]
MYTNQIMLITGGTGSWGEHLVKRLLHTAAKEIRVFSRNEFSQVKMQRSLPVNENRVKFIIGDVRDEDAIYEACKGVDIIFHLAALKHVPICEDQPDEALKTNVVGTENIIRAAIRHKVKKVVDVSTDKACDPVNFYGMTKAIGEKLIIRANDWSPHTRFVCIRGGNVFGTNGSVVPLFKDLLQRRQEIPLTSAKMTRFFLTVNEAIDLLIEAAQAAKGGEIFVMRMKSCRILDLIRVMGKHFGVPKPTIREIGIRPGEKIHEVLVSAYESQSTYQYNEQYYVILSPHSSPLVRQQYSHFSAATFSSYSSDQYLMDDKGIEKLLKKGGLM